MKDGIHSTLHIVHNTEGKQISEWGMRTHAKLNKAPKRINVHIPRQSLRLALLEQLEGNNCIEWGHRLINFKECADNSMELCFQVNEQRKTIKADLIVGADGIYSTVRGQLIGEKTSPLRYSGFMVILGICSLKELKNPKSPLLDSLTVFQTVNGEERIYIMPFSLDSVMWQFSFPIEESKAKALNALGAETLKKEASVRANWHTPIPEIIDSTKSCTISGYPVYDRELLKSKLLEQAGSVCLIGDAAHPMTPFKGQGANQALLDALSLARGISIACSPPSDWKEIGLRECVLTKFEEEMLERSASKVKDSAKAADLLHSKSVLREGNEPKGRLFSN
jgi:salicylate hydroxylase